MCDGVTSSCAAPYQPMDAGLPAEAEASDDMAADPAVDPPASQRTAGGPAASLAPRHPNVSIYGPLSTGALGLAGRYLGTAAQSGAVRAAAASTAEALGGFALGVFGALVLVSLKGDSPDTTQPAPTVAPIRHPPGAPDDEPTPIGFIPLRRQPEPSSDAGLPEVEHDAGPDLDTDPNPNPDAGPLPRVGAAGPNREQAPLTGFLPLPGQPGRGFLPEPRPPGKADNNRTVASGADDDGSPPAATPPQTPDTEAPTEGSPARTDAPPDGAHGLRRETRTLITSLDTDLIAEQLIAASDSDMPIEQAEKELLRSPRADRAALGKLVEEGERMKQMGAPDSALAANLERQARLASFIANTSKREPYLGAGGLPPTTRLNPLEEAAVQGAPRKSWQEIESLFRQHKELAAQNAPLSMLQDIEDQVKERFKDMLASQLRFMEQPGTGGRPLTLDEIAGEIDIWRLENGIYLDTVPAPPVLHADSVSSPSQRSPEALRAELAADWAALDAAMEEEDVLYQTNAPSSFIQAHQENARLLMLGILEKDRQLKRLELPEPAQTSPEPQRWREPWNPQARDMSLQELAAALESYGARGNLETVQATTEPSATERLGQLVAELRRLLDDDTGHSE